MAYKSSLICKRSQAEIFALTAWILDEGIHLYYLEQVM